MLVLVGKHYVTYSRPNLCAFHTGSHPALCITQGLINNFRPALHVTLYTVHFATVYSESVDKCNRQAEC